MSLRIQTSLSVTADHKIQHWVTTDHWEVHPAQQSVNFPGYCFQQPQQKLCLCRV